MRLLIQPDRENVILLDILIQRHGSNADGLNQNHNLDQSPLDIIMQNKSFNDDDFFLCYRFYIDNFTK